MAVPQGHLHVLGNVHFAGALGAARITAEADKIYLHRKLQGPHQVGHENENALEDAHQHRVQAGIVTAEADPQLLDAPLQLLPGKEATPGATVHNLPPPPLTLEKEGQVVKP